MDFLIEDELLLLIAKNNEEAFELLFSLYEKKMSYEAKQFKKKYSNYLESEDYEQDLRLNFYKMLATYDYKKGRFYSFWLSSFRYFAFQYLDLDSENLVLFDSENEMEYISFIYNNDEQKFIYQELNESLKSLKELNVNIYQILILWSQGYKYEEIGEKCNLPSSSVNYYVKKGIEFLKDKME